MQDLPNLASNNKTGGDTTPIGLPKKVDKTGSSQMPSHTPEVDEQINTVAFGVLQIGESTDIPIIDFSNLSIDMFSLDFMSSEMETTMGTTSNELSPQEELASNVYDIGNNLIVNKELKKSTLDYDEILNNNLNQIDLSVQLKAQVDGSTKAELHEKYHVLIWSEKVNAFTFVNLESEGVQNAMVNPNAFVVIEGKVCYLQHQQHIVDKHLPIFQKHFGQNVQFVVVSQAQWHSIFDIIDQAIQRLKLSEKEKVSEEKSIKQVGRTTRYNSVDIEQKREIEKKTNRDNSLTYSLKTSAEVYITSTSERLQRKKHKREEEANIEAREVERSEVRKQERKRETLKEEVQKKMRKQ